MEKFIITNDYETFVLKFKDKEGKHYEGEYCCIDSMMEDYCDAIKNGCFGKNGVFDEESVEAYRLIKFNIKKEKKKNGNKRNLKKN